VPLDHRDLPDCKETLDLLATPETKEMTEIQVTRVHQDRWECQDEPDPRARGEDTVVMVREDLSDQWETRAIPDIQAYQALLERKDTGAILEHLDQQAHPDTMDPRETRDYQDLWGH